MKRALFSLLVIASAISASAQLVVVDNFNSGGTTGATVDGTSWVGNVTQNLGSITITGKDDNGWGTLGGIAIDGSNFGYVSITGQVDSGNVATSLVIEFTDGDSFATTVVSVNTTAFQIGSLSTVTVPITWSSGFNAANIIGYTIGGGTPPPGALAFRMTLDNLALTTSAAVPEPSTYAQIALGLGALGLIAYRRRKTA